MRNTVEYPITKEEIIECLTTLIEDFKYHGDHGLLCGDMRPLLLAKAKEIILTGKFDASL